MTTGYDVTPQQVLQGATDTAGVASDIENGLAYLRKFVASLRGSWQGAAQASFDELMAQWDADAKSLHDALTGIADGLKATYDSYSGGEHANLTVIKQVTAAMPPARLS